MDTQHCLQCEFHKDRVDQDGWKYCYCFFNPDKGRWVAEIENCPKLGKHHGSSEIPNDLEEAAEKLYPEKRQYVSAFGTIEYISPWSKSEKDAFIAGYKLAKEQMLKDGLDAVKSCQFDKIEKTIAGVFVKYGMDMQKQDMMKGAVEGTIVDAGFDDHTALVSIPDKRYDEGDKVRIIIVKEDEE